MASASVPDLGKEKKWKQLHFGIFVFIRTMQRDLVSVDNKERLENLGRGIN